MTQFNNERLRNLRIGISSYTDNEVVLDVIGKSNFNSGIGIGGSIYDINDSSGDFQYVLTSIPGGVLWQSVTGTGAITGINIQPDVADVIRYIPSLSVSAGTTAVLYSNPSSLTYNPLSNSFGIGTTNPTSNLYVVGDAYFSGIITATSFDGSINYSDTAGIATYASIAGVSTSVIGGIGSITSLSVSGVTTTGTLNVGVGGTIITTTGIGSVGIGSTLPGSTLVVNAPSGYTGNILDLRTSGNPQLGISTTGQYIAYDSAFGASHIFRFANQNSINSNGLSIWNNGGTAVVFGYGNTKSANTNWFTLDGATFYVKKFGFNTVAQNSGDLFLERDSANVLAQRNAGVGQTFRLYNTYTSASQYERAYLGWNNNVFQIGVDTAGISTARSISLVGAAGSNTGDTLQPLQINQTWTAGSGIATAITLNLTNTSSGANSSLLDMRVGGTSQFRVAIENDIGSGTANKYALRSQLVDFRSFYGSPFIMNGSGASNGIKIGSSTSNYLDIEGGSKGLAITFSSGTVNLVTEGNSVLAQRNYLSPGIGQTFRLYNTYTSATNFERANVGWTTNTFIVGTEKGSAGGTARQLELQTDRTTRVAITTTGNVGIGSTQPTAKLDVVGDVKATRYYGEPEISPVMMSMIF